MHNYSSHGYLVKASDLTKVLPARFQKEYAAAVDEGDYETAMELAEANMPEQLPAPEAIFTLADDAEFDDDELQKGEMYAMFDEGDLYKKVPTVVHSNLIVEGIKPIYHSWVDYA